MVTGLLVTAFILFLIIFHTDFFARNTGRMFSRYLFEGTRFSLSMSSLSGNPLTGVTAKDIRIRYSGDDYSFDVVRIDELRCRYNARSLIGDSPAIEELILKKPHVWIKPDSTGVNIIPYKRSAGIGGRLPRFEVQNFSIEDGQVILQGKERADAARDINLQGLLKSTGNEVLVEIMSGSGLDIRRNLEYNKVKGRIRWLERGDHTAGADRGFVFLEDFGLSLDKSKINLTGRISPDSMSVDLNMKVAPLNIEEVAGAIGLETSHYGELQGSMRLKGSPDSLRIEGILKGIFSGYALDDFKVDLGWRPPLITLARGSGKFNGAEVDGSGYYSTGEPRLLNLDFLAKDLDLSGGFVPGRKMPETRFNGRVRLEYYPDSRHMNFDMDLGEGHLRGFPFETAVFQGSYSADSLALDRIVMDSGTHSVRAEGYILDGEWVRMLVDLSCSGEDTLFSYFGIEDYRADLDIKGIWEGSFKQWDLHANGLFSDFGYHGVLVPRGEIKLAVGKQDRYKVLLDLSADSCFVASAGFTGMEFSLEYADGLTLVKNLNLQRDAVKAEMRGEVRNSGERTEIVVTELLLDAAGEIWRSSGNFGMYINDSAVEFDDLQLHSKLGAFYLDCAIDRDREFIEGRFTFERLDLILMNSAGLVKTPLQGKSRGTITCRGPLSDPGFTADLFIEKSLFDTIAVDSVSLKSSYSSKVMVIASLSMVSPSGDFRMKGTVSGTTPNDFYRDRGKALRNVSLDLEADCSKLSLAPFMKLFSGNPFENGLFTGSLSLSDSLAYPGVSLNGRIEKLSTSSIVLPAVELAAEIGEENIELEGDLEISHEQKGTFRGRIPIMKKKWFYSLDGSRQIFLSLIFPESDLGVVKEMTDVVAEVDGRFMAEFRVQGTPNAPVFYGELNLRDTEFRFSGMEERFVDVSSRIVLQDTVITVASFKGKEGKEGSFGCTGTITLEGWRPKVYALKIGLDKFLVASMPDVMAIVTGNLDISTYSENGRVIPEITGKLHVNRAEVYYDLGDFGSEVHGSTMEPPSLIAAVDLEVTSNTWLKTSDANVELQGEVTVHHDQRGTYLRGNLDLLRGTYNVYNNKFRVNSGTLSFVRAEGFRPVVDIEAETLDPEGRKIYLDLAWHQDDIEPRLSLHHEDPGYSETDIWKMLGGGVIGSPDGNGDSWDAVGTAQHLAANYIERMLNSQMEGVTIELETAAGSEGSSDGFEENETVVAIGKYLSEGLYVKYKQGLSISTARHIEVEYRISKLFLVRSEIIRYSEKVLQGKSRRSSDEINVDLKLRWEY